MKASKKIKLLQGVTAIRVRLGLTQAQLAEQIKVSRSAISMLESGKRTIPTAALIRLSKLEISLMNTGFSDEDLIRGLNEKEKALEKMQMLRIAGYRLQVGELRYKVNQMKTRFGELSEASNNLRFLLQNSTDAVQTARLRMALERVEAKIKRCDRQAQAKLEGRMAQLEIIIAASEPEESDARITLIAEDEAKATPRAIPAIQPLAIPKGYTIDAALLNENPKQELENRRRPEPQAVISGHYRYRSVHPISSSTSVLPLLPFYTRGSSPHAIPAGNRHSSKTRSQFHHP